MTDDDLFFAFFSLCPLCHSLSFFSFLHRNRFIAYARALEIVAVFELIYRPACTRIPSRFQHGSVASSHELAQSRGSLSLFLSALHPSLLFHSH